jgi:EmrB/QacA subfamily drug resistance transporter
LSRPHGAPVLSAGPPGAEPSAAPKGNARTTLILALLVIAQFVVVLDFSIVQIALPTIRADFGISLSDLQWVVSAYGLTFAGLLMFSGRASDLYGRKNLFILGLAIFSLSSLAGGLATSEFTLIAARTVQGVGAALASASGLALIVAIFAPLGKLNWALGIFAAVSSAGFTAGVILGGVLTQALGWRWVFFVNVPIGIIAAVIAISVIPASPRRQSGVHLDVPGALTVTSGLILLVYALSDAGYGGFSLRDVAAFGLSALILATFLFVEHRSKAPLMPLGFLRRRTVFLSNAIALLIFASNTSLVFAITLYFQQLRGYSPLSAGLALVPSGLLYIVIGGYLAPKLVKKVGARLVLAVAMVFLAVGTFMLTRITIDSGYVTVIVPAILVASVGGALGLTASNIAALSGAIKGEEGVASGLINTSRQVGGPVGLALIVTIIGSATGGLGAAASPGELLPALQYAFGGATVFGTLATVLALLMKGRSSKAPVSGPGNLAGAGAASLPLPLRVLSPMPGPQSRAPERDRTPSVPLRSPG